MFKLNSAGSLLLVIAGAALPLAVNAQARANSGMPSTAAPAQASPAQASPAQASPAQAAPVQAAPSAAAARPAASARPTTPPNKK